MLKRDKFFIGGQGVAPFEPLTRFGMRYLLRKYCDRPRTRSRQ